jgi:hypothetical protein
MTRLGSRLDLPPARGSSVICVLPAPPDHDEIDRTARSVIIENADRQPSGSPGERIEVGPALVQQRPFGEIIMAVNDVEIAEPSGEPFRITLAQQRRLALLIQGNFRIDAGMHINAMGIDMYQPQAIEPGDVAWRHGAAIAAIRGQRRITALGDPPRHLRLILQRLDHHRVVVPLQRNQTPALGNARQQPVDDLFAFRPLVDVIADREYDAGIAPGDDLSQTLVEQIKSAVNIRDDVGLRHGDGRESLHFFNGCRRSTGPVMFTLPATGTCWIQVYQATDLGLSFHSAP